MDAQGEISEEDRETLIQTLRLWPQDSRASAHLSLWTVEEPASPQTETSESVSPNRAVPQLRAQFLRSDHYPTVADPRHPAKQSILDKALGKCAQAVLAINVDFQSIQIGTSFESAGALGSKKRS